MCAYMVFVGHFMTVCLCSSQMPETLNTVVEDGRSDALPSWHYTWPNAPTGLALCANLKGGWMEVGREHIGAHLVMLHKSPEFRYNNRWSSSLSVTAGRRLVFASLDSALHKVAVERGKPLPRKPPVGQSRLMESLPTRVWHDNASDRRAFTYCCLQSAALNWSKFGINYNNGPKAYPEERRF